MTDPAAEVGARPSELARRSGRNAFFNVAAFAHAAVAAIVLTPFLVDGLGPTFYGIYALTAAALGIVGMLDLGMTTTLLRFLARAFARGGEGEAREVVRSSLTFYAAVGIAGFAVMAGLALLVEHLFELDPGAAGVARFAFVVGGAAFAFDVLTRALGTVPLSLQRYDIAAYVRIAFRTVLAGVSIGLVVSGYGLRALVVAAALVDLVAFGVTALVARRLVPALSLVPSLDAGRVRSLMTFSGWIFLGNLSAFLIFQFDRILLGALGSVSAVTYYAVAGSAASYVYAAIVSLAAVALPVATDLFARGDLERVRRLYVRATRICVLAAGSLGIPIVVFADPILSLWLDEEFAGQATTLLQILVATYVVLSFTVVPYNVLVGAARPRVVALLNLAIAALNIALVVVLIPPYGATGAALAYLIAVSLFPLFIHFAEREALEHGRLVWPQIVWRPLVALAVQGGACLALQPVVEGAVSLVLALAVTVPLAALVFLVTPLADDEERALLRSLLGR